MLKLIMASLLKNHYSILLSYNIQQEKRERGSKKRKKKILQIIQSAHKNISSREILHAILKKHVLYILLYVTFGVYLIIY